MARDIWGYLFCREHEVIQSITSHDEETHNSPPPTTIVKLLHDRRVKIMEIQLSLEIELMVGVEEVEGEHCLRSIERGGVPTHPQKLAVGFYPTTGLLAFAELHIQVMCAIEADDEDTFVMRWFGGWTAGVFMTDEEDVTGFREADTLVETTSPHLRSC